MEMIIKRWRGWIIISTTIVAVVLTWLLPPFGQDPAYHNFADTRQLLGIPNFFDVVSNLAFALVGIAGLLAVPRLTSQQSLVENRLSYKIFLSV